MISFNSNSSCKKAKAYYYDLLHNESCGPAPEFIAEHVEQCRYCQQQINQLKAALSQADDIASEQNQVNSDPIIAMLNLHFDYIGRSVTCQTVKPFLPTLLDPALSIRIPTPITAHLDNCRQCAEDLEAIRGLKLNRKQLRRLSLLFAEEPCQDFAKCPEMEEAIKSVAAMTFAGITAQALQHLCRCPVCRDLLYQQRQKIDDSLPEHSQSPQFSCESVSATDIFDYVIPYGLDPADDQYEKFRKSLTSHIITCRNCLAKMQQLHNTIYSIAERTESKVATIYQIDGTAKLQEVGVSDDLYAGFPIRVETASGEDEVDAELPASTFGKKLKPLLKPALAAAAAIFIAVAVLLHTAPAKAVSIERIYEAIEKIKNIYIASFVPSRKEPTQEKWVSRTLGIYMAKAGNELALWDIPNRVRKIKNQDTAIAETTLLTADVIASIEKKMSGSLGLMPFYDISEMPKDAEWSRVIDGDLGAVINGNEVYDLNWSKYSGTVAFKWRFFVDPKTNLPHRTEFYQKLPTDDEYILISGMEIQYLSDSKIQQAIKDASF